MTRFEELRDAAHKARDAAAQAVTDAGVPYLTHALHVRALPDLPGPGIVALWTVTLERTAYALVESEDDSAEAALFAVGGARAALFAFVDEGLKLCGQVPS